MSLLLLITMLDGSQVNLNVDRALYFDVGTKYGVLKVPLADVTTINFGVHYEDEELYKRTVKEFANGKYKSRDGAFKMLAQNQRWAYKWLKSVENDSDQEVKNRAVALLKLYKQTPALSDVLVLHDGVLDGHIKQLEVVGESVSLGKLALRISQIKSITTRQPNQEWRVSLKSGWTKIGFVDGTCDVTATGIIDMFPTQPGQYMAEPNGSTNGTVYQDYPAGALLGRLNGKKFLVGSAFYADNMGRGELEVIVNAAPWSTTFEGEYVVKLK